MVRRIALTIAVAFILAIAIDVPGLINYQGKLTNAAGQPQQGTFNMVFTIYDAATGGTLYWEEEQEVTTDAQGLFNVLLGSVNPPVLLPEGPDCYLEITVEGTTLSPRQRIVSNGYSYYARTTDNAMKLGGLAAANYAVLPIETGEIANNAVNSAKIQDGQVFNDDLAANAVTESKIADNAVTSVKIRDGEVYNPDIADNAVTTGKIADANVTLSKISPAGSSSGQAIISTGSGTAPIWGNPTPAPHTHTATGDVTGTVTGTLTIAENAVTSAKIADLTIAAADIATGAVTSAKILDGTIATADIASGAVTASAQFYLNPPYYTWSITTSWATIPSYPVSLSFTTTGGPLLINVSINGICQMSYTYPLDFVVGLFRAGTLIASARGSTPYGTYYAHNCISFTFIDQPPAGTYTYDIRVRHYWTSSYTVHTNYPSGGGSGSGSYILSIVELKR